MSIGSFGSFSSSVAKILCWPISYCLGSEDKRSYHAALDAWVEKSQYGDVDKAAWILRDACDRETDYVDLSGLGLTTWPPLPRVRMVDIRNNALTNEPHYWPETVIKIIASHNKMTEISHLPEHVDHIDFSNNALKEICNLSQVEHIDLRNNALCEMPAMRFALYADLRDNDIRDVWDDDFSPNCKFKLNGEALESLQAHRNLPKRLQPVPERQGCKPTRLEGGLLKYWMRRKNVPGYHEISRPVRKRWCEILDGGEKKNAEEFINFLGELPEALGLKHDCDFERGITLWLERLAKSNAGALRKETFALAAIDRPICNDSILMKFKRMEIALIEHDISHGKFNSWAECIALTREIFRFKMLGFVGAEMARTMGKDADPIEHRLGLGLHHGLNFRTRVRDMHYRESAPLEDIHFSKAALKVRTAENEGFRRWLSTFPAWNEAVKLAEPALFEKAESEWKREFASWRAESNQALAAEAAGDAEASIKIRKMERDILREVRQKRDAKFAEMYGFAKRLRPFWDLEKGKRLQGMASRRTPLLYMMRTKLF